MRGVCRDTNRNSVLIQLVYANSDGETGEGSFILSGIVLYAVKSHRCNFLP